jgi:deoxyadenosine/deoxycytidine kinase
MNIIPVQYVAVEGNTGSGKSTFLHFIGALLDCQLVFEPLAAWQNVDGVNLLEYFYKDSHRWSYTFQSYAFTTRVLQQEAVFHTYPRSIQLVERSVYADRYCFAQNCFEMGLMNGVEWKTYEALFEGLVTQRMSKPKGFIYLRTDPEVCYQRLVKRNRSEELHVSKEYFKTTHDRYEHWFSQHYDIGLGIAQIPVLVLDINKDFEHDSAEQKRHSQKVRDFFVTIGLNGFDPIKK